MTARTIALAVFMAPCLCLAQAPVPAPRQAPAAPSAQAPTPAPAAALPVKRVILYKTGIGYFEHLGQVRNRQEVTIRFTSAQLNDALKSLTAIDLGQGRITGISYNSVAPVQQRLSALRLPIGEEATSATLLGALRGARVEVTSGAATVTGRLLSVEEKTRGSGEDRSDVHSISIVTDSGEVRSYDLTPAVRIRVVERDLRQEIDRYLDVVASAREQDVRSLSIATDGKGERPLLVSYISEVPIWKSTYRLVLSGSADPPLLQGWAIVDNTIGEDWTDVELSLVAGAPQSFIQNLSQPQFGARDVIPLPTNVRLTPQTHDGTLRAGVSALTGTVRDPAGTVMPGVSVRLTGPSGVVATAVTGSDGSYRLNVPQGRYQVRFELPGFGTVLHEGVEVAAGESRQDGTLRVGSLTETVRVDALTPTMGGRGGRAAAATPGGVMSGVVGGIPAPPPSPPLDRYQQASREDPAAAAASLGDLFEYRLKQPVTLGKNQSALVPIVNTTIAAEKVALWTGDRAGGTPLRAVWITNGSGLTLDGGSLSVIDANAFAGEGLIEPLKPGERRLVSYAAELGMRVKQDRSDAPGRVVRVRAQKGVIIQEAEQRATWTYTIRNENAAATTILIEHRLRPGWRLMEGQPTAESTLTAHRFRVVVEPKKDATLVVREVRAEESRMAIAGLNDSWMTQMAQSGVSAEELQRALKPVLDKRNELAEKQRRLDELRAEQQSIAGDQQRVRENMKVLRGSAEEKQLLQRYTTQLDTQETRLDALKGLIAKASDERSAVDAELAALIATLSFELSGAR